MSTLLPVSSEYCGVALRNCRRIAIHPRKPWPPISNPPATPIPALRAGASAYVLKKSTAQELVHAICQGLAGYLFLSPPLNERAIEVYVQKTQETPWDPYETLTAREQEVLHLAAEGLSNTEIAARLSISPRTVEMHHGNLMRKLRLRTQTDLIRYALRRGILPLDS